MGRQNFVWIHQHVWIKNLFDLMHGTDSRGTFGKVHEVSLLEAQT